MSVTSITASVLIERKVFCHLIQKHIFRIELLMLDLIFASLCDDQNNMRSYTDNAEEGSKLMTICISHNPLGQDR
jgi:hypothetical protein